jgi:RNA polymerase sigma-70 factor (ECF subfamily)
MSNQVNAVNSYGTNAGHHSELAESNETRLVDAAKNGQKSAFGELCERHTAKVFRVVHRITRNREDAEDAVQDCFLSAFVHLKDFDGRSQFVTWLTRIAINAALAKLRKKRGIREIPMEEPGPTADFEPHYEVVDAALNPEETYGQQERNQVLNAAIGGLRPRARRVVEVHQLQEYSIRETAQILGISTAAAKARMFHARIALRRMPMLRTVGRSMSANAV